MHAFIDESQRSRYILTAVVLHPSDLSRVRSAMRKLVLPGQERIHFRTESDRQRRMIISGIASLGVSAEIVTASGATESSRAACLHELVLRLSDLPVRTYLLESRDQSRDRGDRRTIFTALSKAGCTARYDHALARQEPLLWLPDIIGWAHGHGGDWGRRVKPLMRSVTTLP